MRAAVAILAALALAPATAQAAPKLPLTHAGRWITDARGRVVILHGLNMVYKRPPYAPDATGFGADDARFLQANGFDTVRLGVIFAAVEPQPNHYDDAYLARIRRTVDLLGRHGIVSLLDFHQDLYSERFQGEGFPSWAIDDDGLPALPQTGFPGNYFAMPALNRAFDNFWANANHLQDAYAAAWGHVARRFAKDRYVLGYDVMNEPWPGTPWTTCAQPTGCPAFDRTLSGMYARAASAIRRVDRRHLVFSEPNVLFNSGAPTSVRSTGALSFHDYCLGGGEQVCQSLDDRVFANADAHSRQNGDALLLTEFGATSDATTLEDMVDRADRFMVGWQEWHYCGCDDPTTSGPGTEQALVIDPRKPPRGANVEQAKMKLLARPHPIAIAGTPTLIRFDAKTSRFTLRYTTRRASGRGRFSRHAVTEIAVPRMRYRVRVTGGRARARGRVLKVSARRRAVTVTVTRRQPLGVSPAAGPAAARARWSSPRGSGPARSARPARP